MRLREGGMPFLRVPSPRPVSEENSKRLSRQARRGFKPMLQNNIFTHVEFQINMVRGNENGTPQFES